MCSERSDDETMSIERSYRVLKKAEVQKYQRDDIALVSTTLSISTSAAAILLHYYAWNIFKLQDAWFDDEDGVRKSVGLHNNPAVGFRKSGELMVCAICVDDYVFDPKFETSVGFFCGHSFCTACLETFVSKAIDDGPGCLCLRCPDPTCRAVIGQDMVNLLVSAEAKTKYNEFLFRSYVASNKKIKWCPAPDCQHVIEYEFGSESYDVTCDCSLSFCWNCLEDSHRPLDCETVAKWKLKNSSESENVTWILGNCKPCPSCNVPIEMIGGSCSHVTCLCGCEFCWTCLGPYTDHNRTDHNSYMQKSYEERLRDRAKRYSMKYVHYFERWAANHKLKVQAIQALADLRDQMETGKLVQSGDLRYLIAAWEQIVECRRVLKWTYAYGYYMEEGASKKKLLECLQGEAEVALERLSGCAKTMHNKLPFLDPVMPEFDKNLKTELLHQTCLTRFDFENLVNEFRIIYLKSVKRNRNGSKIKFLYTLFISSMKKIYYRN